MTTQELEKIKNLLQEFRRIKEDRCSRVDPDDGNQGARIEAAITRAQAAKAAGPKT